MPSRAPTHKPQGWKPPTPWQRSPHAPQRIAGRALQTRNEWIKARDQYICQRCGRLTVELEIDHVVPVYAGGTDDDSNVQALCRPCHRRKTVTESLAARGIGPDA